MMRFLVLTLTFTISVQALYSQQLGKWKQRLTSTGLSVGINPLNPNTVYAQNSTGTFLVSYNRGQTWTSRGNMPSQQVREILVHPLDTTVILCAAFTGGLHRSSDGGLTWTTVIPGFGIDGESIALNPVYADTIYAGDYSTTNVYQSTNRGATWDRMGTIGGSICAFTVRPDSTNILYAGAGAGRIAKTTDYGATWRVVKPEGSEEIPKIVINRFQPLTAFGAAYEGPDSTEGVWKTADGGEHWFRTSLQARSIWSLDIDNTNPSIVFAGTFSENSATVFVTSDAGNSWIPRATGIPPSSDAWNIKVHPLDGNVVWLAEQGSSPGVYQYVSTRTIVEGVVLDNATGDTIRNGWIVETSSLDTVNLSTSQGAFSFGFFSGDPSLTPTLHIVAYPYFTSDVTVTFVPDSTVAQRIQLQRLPTASITGTLRDSLTLQPISARVALFVATGIGPRILSDTTDQNGAFAFHSQYVSQPPSVQYDHIEIDPAIPNPHLVLPGFTLTGAGVSFPLLSPRADVLLVCADSIRFANYYESALDSIGVSWNFWTQSEPAPLSKVHLFRKNDVIFYTANRNTPFSPEESDSLLACVAAGGNLLLTGQNIAENNDTTSLLRDVVGVQFGGNVNPLSSVSGVANELFNSLSFGTFGSGGANNQISKDRLTVVDPQTRACLVYNVSAGTAAVRREVGAGKILFMGFGFEGITSTSARRSVMQRVVGYFDGSLSAGVSDEISPVKFHLDQNYPNPFNPSTTIAYSLPQEATVTLEVYDVIGRTVLTLVDKEREQAGQHKVTFDATTLSSGVYLYRITAGPFVETRKLVVLK